PSPPRPSPARLSAPAVHAPRTHAGGAAPGVARDLPPVQPRGRLDGVRGRPGVFLAPAAAHLPRALLLHRIRRGPAGRAPGLAPGGALELRRDRRPLSERSGARGEP